MTINKCEICGEEINTDTHHIRSLSKGGEDISSNRCKICPNCHRLVHVGDIIIEGRFLVLSKEESGNILIYRKKGDNSITCVKDPEVFIYGD